MLIVEDEEKLASLLKRGLTEEGHVAELAGDGNEAVWMARASRARHLDAGADAHRT